MIIEDDVFICKELMQFFENNGYSTQTLDTNNCDVLQVIQESTPDLILLDINLPNIDGFSLCRQIRNCSTIPIIFITARDSAIDELNGLTMGGDDYITKPYNLPLLLARVKNLLKRVDSSDKQKIKYREIILNLISATVEYQNAVIELSRTELKIMYYLFQNVGSIVPRIDLVEYLWDNHIHIDDNALSVNITRLREKLMGIGITDLIITKRGMGYRI
ncbi:response regulator transcription factor [Clostridioides difficile]|uniref:response regulator transcription factor n=1 Tax=Clostridioides difficile TaxID=1496 RepID=UPI001F2DA9C7|nr:response regulator transcription factor [Clostridioides difficile]MCI2309631.1 response regulator transcription factor [Clostridioides difficile]MCI4303183.1 response regulator transcription factor [Clostridioides difficile]MCK3745237.1 response regulator transcription factor [Clostridioides difficile]MCM4099340.1 response regulator transcription factor [Clostridioides difficile]MCP3281836.1 response regulator transcription factor [Clostridioides difficile]